MSWREIRHGGGFHKRTGGEGSNSETLEKVRKKSERKQIEENEKKREET